MSDELLKTIKAMADQLTKLTDSHIQLLQKVVILEDRLKRLEEK